MKTTKRQNAPLSKKGVLSVIATPLGNLSDLSLRAKEAIEQADEIFCEDTRRTATLLSVLGLKKKLTRLDANMENQGGLRFVLRALEEGKRLAYMTDAGTPGVSDPGQKLVRVMRDQGYLIEVIPGPSAVTALLSIAGIESQGFAFWGYFPREKMDQEAQFERAEIASNHGLKAQVWFESPKRIKDATRAIAARWPDAYALVVKELTKMHERKFHGKISEVSDEIRLHLEEVGEIGEWSLVVEIPEVESNEGSVENWMQSLKLLLQARVGATECSSLISGEFGVSKKIVYAEFLRQKKNFTPGA